MTGVTSARAGLAAGCALALALMCGTAGALAASGGVSSSGDGGSGGDCVKAKFGSRALERGDCGGDVVTLNWMLRGRSYDVPLERRFRRPTHLSVRDFQGRRGIAKTGVVNDRTRDELVGGMRRHLASWYGPGFFGNTTACGQTLRKRTRGVAHRTLPCGTKVVVAYGGRFARARVIDRGPYVKRRYERDWDLTRALARKLRFEGVDRIRTSVVR